MVIKLMVHTPHFKTPAEALVEAVFHRQLGWPSPASDPK